MCCCQFNDNEPFYSDIDTIDTAYQKVLGMTKVEDERILAEEQANREQEQTVFEAKKGELKEHWIAEGKKVIDPKYWDRWEKCVESAIDSVIATEESVKERLSDYLNIIDSLNKHVPFDKVMEQIGFKYELNCSLSYYVIPLCDRGMGLLGYDYIKNGMLKIAEEMLDKETFEKFKEYGSNYIGFDGDVNALRDSLDLIGIINGGEYNFKQIEEKLELYSTKRDAEFVAEVIAIAEQIDDKTKEFVEFIQGGDIVEDISDIKEISDRE